MDEIKRHAQAIKQYCAEHTTKEQECPFFKGYRKENGANIVICELNKGQCSPCNWDV